MSCIRKRFPALLGSITERFLLLRTKPEDLLNSSRNQAGSAEETLWFSKAQKTLYSCGPKQSLHPANRQSYILRPRAPNWFEMVVVALETGTGQRVTGELRLRDETPLYLVWVANSPPC